MRLRKAATVVPQKHITDGIDKVEKRLMNCNVAKSYRKNLFLISTLFQEVPKINSAIYIWIV